MEFETLEQYRQEGETEREGWRGLIGKTLTFAGFIVLANAFIVSMCFRHMLAFKYEIICAVIGGFVGVIGMRLRGNNLDQILTAAGASAATIFTMIVMRLLESYFGWAAMIVVAIVFVLLVQKLEEHAWKKL
jgi:hypothetical protein